MHSTSAIPKSPIAATTSSIPSNSRIIPKVKRAAPKTGSSPTIEKRSPSAAIMRPLRIESPPR